MKRRSFVKTSLLAGTLSSVMQSSANAKKEINKAATRNYYELRTYLLKDAAQQKLVEDYYLNAAVAAYNKIGSQHIGIFTEMKPEGQTKIYVLIPYNSIEDFTNSNDKLNKDNVYLKAADAYLNAPSTSPAYERMETSLLYAFRLYPQIKTDASKARMFELRRYESSGEAAGKKKIEMFNDAGEIDVFLQTGFHPVFFSESLIGEARPNLTYMLQFADMNEHDASWKTFGSSPQWNKLKAIPEYADAKIVSKITSTFLVPADFSQI